MLQILLYSSAMKLYILFLSASRRFLRIKVLIKISLSDLDDFVNKAKAPAFSLFVVSFSWNFKTLNR